MKIEIRDGSNDAHFNFTARYDFADPAKPDPHDVEFSGTVKWDGCTHLYNGDPNVPAEPGLEGPEYMHLCAQFDQAIELLTALRDEGRRRWRERHPDIWKS